MPSLHQIGLMHELLKYEDIKLAMFVIVVVLPFHSFVCSLVGWLVGSNICSIHINCNSMRHWLITKPYESWNIYENPLFIRLDFFASFIFTTFPSMCFDSVNAHFEIWHMVYTPTRTKISQLSTETLKLMRGQWKNKNPQHPYKAVCYDVFWCSPTFVFSYLNTQVYGVKWYFWIVIFASLLKIKKNLKTFVRSI